MVGELNKIIFDTLTVERAVYLPDVGSLAVERRAARMVSRRRLRRAHNAVVFTSQQCGRSVVDSVAAACGIDEGQAREIYDRWLSKCRDGNLLTIEGVGRIDRKTFVADEALKMALNPDGSGESMLRPYGRGCGGCIMTIAVTAILAAACGAAALMYPEQCKDFTTAVKSLFMAKPAAVASTQEPESGYPADGNDGSSTETPDDAQAEPELPATDVQAVEPAADNHTDHTAAGNQSGGQQAAGTATASASRANKADDAGKADKADRTENNGKTDRADQAPVVTTANAAETAAGNEVGRLQSRRSYVVLGVFSTAENALRAVAETRAEGINSCAAYVYGAKFMTALYSSDSRAECTEFMKAYAGRYENIWIYTAH